MTDLLAVADGKNEPDWYALASDLANAVKFQRSTRRVHAIGKDGRARMGCVDLLGCYAVDEAARAFFAALGQELEAVDPPTEAEAMFMLARGLTWRSWLGDAAGVRYLASQMSPLPAHRARHAMAEKEGEDEPV